MAEVRRSSRTRQQATSIYDEAKKEIEEKEADFAQDQDSETESQGYASDQEMNDVETGAEAAGAEASDDESSEEEEDFKPSAPKKASPAEKKKKTQKKTQIKVGRENQPKKPKATGGTTTRRGAQSALTALAKKVLYETENPNNSLVAALLNSYKGASPSKSRSTNDQEGSIYTPQLERIARRVIEEYKNDPNRAQVLLLNLLFRSVGGNIDTNLDPDKSSLEDMDNEEWAKVVTDLVDVMRHTFADRILICADPNGAAHAQAVSSGKELDTSEPGPASFGVREYRKIYEEFWYVLGSVALTEGIASNDDNDVDSDEESVDEEQRQNKSFTTTSRFDAEVVRELISRMTELVTVGQPDVRAAATVAALELGHAVLNQTAQLAKKLEVATRQYESAASGKKDGPLSKKAQSFKHQVDSLKRTKDDLEEIVTTSIIQGVFMHRYRDSSMYIRATALKSLSRMTLQRPDLFLVDKYLKYFGWMVSDKDASVRVASLQGLHAPFLAVQQGRKSRKNPIDLQQMVNVITKFLPKLADCVLDVNSVVQEHAMALLLALEREAFLDEVMDDNLWTQINIQALSSETTPKVRRDALYFVMDQLEAFDEEDIAETKSSKKNGRSKDASLTQSSERMMVQRLDALACWVGDALSDGPIPVDKIRLQIADYVVESLREMPEHKALVTNWNAMLRAIGEDSAATTGDTAADRIEVAKQRVLVQMLARAAQAEVVAVADPSFLSIDLDPDEADVEAEENAITTTKFKKRKGKKSTSAGMPHEVLSVALLNSLPDLLIKFKVDTTILGSLTTLPRYILPSVFSLTQRKNDFTALVKNLCDIYLESSDEYVLQNIALSLTSLSQGGHKRSTDVNLQLQRVASTLSGRVIDLLSASDEAKEAAGTKKQKSPKKSSKRKRTASKSRSDDTEASDDEDKNKNSESKDSEYAISFCLRRLRILSKRCNLSELLDESASDDDEMVVGTIGDLCDAVVTGMEKRLKERAIKLDALNGADDDDERNVEIPETWKSGDQSIHDVVSCSVRESLSLLLSITAWKLFMTQKEYEMIIADDEDILMEPEEGDETDKHGVVRHRDQLFVLLVLCFEQFLPPFGDPSEEESMYSKEHVAFSDEVQTHACSIAGDLRSLFSKDWAEAAHPILRACALTDDQNIAGGLVRFMRSKETELRIAQEAETIDLSPKLLLPLMRSIASNWMHGNRREAGVVLAHVTDSGAEAGKMVSSFSRVLKKINPIRLLEAHMACLRQSYQEWVNDEPEDPEEGETGPTDEAMEEFEQAEKKHAEQFHLLEQQAARLSQSLGVGKLSDPKLSESILGFVRNGIKFAFDHNDNDDFELGARLNFLSIMSKYATWIKKDRDHLRMVRLDLEEAEETLREHPDFHEVPEEDKALIASFRNALGIKKTTREETSPRSVTDDDSRNSMGDEYSDDGDSVTRASINTGGSSRLRRSQGGASVASVRSKLSSAPGSLSPLYEEDASVEESPDEASERRPKRRKGNRASIGSTLSVSTMGQSQPTIAEGSGESGSETDDGGSY